MDALVECSCSIYYRFLNGLENINSIIGYTILVISSQEFKPFSDHWQVVKIVQTFQHIKPFVTIFHSSFSPIS